MNTFGRPHTPPRAARLSRSSSSSSENDSPSGISSPPRRSSSGASIAVTTATCSTTSAKPSLNSTARRPISRLPRRPLNSTLPPNNQDSGSPRRPAKNGGGGKGSRVYEEDESDGNKENIAPFRLASLTTPSASSIPPRRNSPCGDRRLYSESYVAALLGMENLGLGSGRHVVDKPSADQEHAVVSSKGSDLEQEDGKVEQKGEVSLGALESPRRLTKSIMSSRLEKDGKAVFLFGICGGLEGSDFSSDSDDQDWVPSDSDSDDGSSLSSGSGRDESSGEGVESDSEVSDYSDARSDLDGCA